MRRLPPKNIENDLTGLLGLVPEQTDEILQRVDQPIQEMTDTVSVCYILYDISHMLFIIHTICSFSLTGSQIFVMRLQS